jgi:integrase
VPFGNYVANALRERKLKKPGELVFATDKGTIFEHSNLVKASIIPAAREAGVPQYTGLHCLRHFYASWCIDRGVQAKIIQERMGHASITVTMDTYGHLFPRGDDLAELTEAEESIMAL